MKPTAFGLRVQRLEPLQQQLSCNVQRRAIAASTRRSKSDHSGASSPSSKVLVLFLGNHGPKFEGTRHNAGFAVGDRTASLLGSSTTPQTSFPSRKRWLSDVCEIKELTFDYIASMRGDDLIDRRSDRSKQATEDNGVWRPSLESVNLVKPRTYMNRSGLAARPALSDLRLQANDRNSVLVVCDDLTIPLGQLRMKPGGSSGGQNGLESILKVTRTEEVARLRIGMGKRAIGGGLERVKPSLALGRLNAREQALFHDVSKYAAQVIRIWLFRGFDSAASLANILKLDTQDDDDSDS
ncbi:hypothetical protein FOL46_005118 [Perkinsus olseni]|uniref:Peptidyl-tRNA hydrolase n=1 Tax=Perkinsus olseni TaxID=32597 RepID=A0A7J6LUH8_PEROL|nr:hypothetical protein FOL46_005118 [Perkinsus olseni]